jgi:hypothetical protein
VGLAFRLVVPLVLIVVHGGAGVFSGLMPDRFSADEYSPSERPQHRSSGDIGDLRLRDLGDLAVSAVRSVLQGGLALLNGVAEPEPRRQEHWLDEPRRTHHGEPYEASPEFGDDRAQRDTRHGW